MSKIQVEVRFTDKLKSIRVGGQEMEIPKPSRQNLLKNGLNRRLAV